jgi:uncharacterized membrane protein YkvA (DUF1232 family)
MADHRDARYRLQDEDEDGLDDEVPVRRAIQAPRLRRRPRPEAAEPRDAGDGRERLVGFMRDLLSFVKLLGRLARDPRVSKLDKALCVATVAYVLMPIDFIPDVIPFLGQVDDIYLVMLTLDRLLTNSGMDVLLDHWDGEPEHLERLIAGLEKASSFLPEPIRRLLHRRAG